MAGLCAPLPTLHLRPREGKRTAWGTDVDRYSFIASDLHRLLLAGLPAHNPLSSTRKSAQIDVISSGTISPLSRGLTSQEEATATRNSGFVGAAMRPLTGRSGVRLT